MVKKNNNFLGEETGKTIPKASRNRKKLRRSRKPKFDFDFDLRKPKRRIDAKKKDKKRKRKQTLNTQIAQLREDLGRMSDDIWEINQWLDEYPSMFDAIRERIQLWKELDSLINAAILDLLEAWLG